MLDQLNHKTSISPGVRDDIEHSRVWTPNASSVRYFLAVNYNVIINHLVRQEEFCQYLSPRQVQVMSLLMTIVKGHGR